MVKAKEKKVVGVTPNQRNLKVPKLDQDPTVTSLPADYQEMMELWGDEAKELLKQSFSSLEEALNAFVSLMLQKNQLSEGEKEQERKLLFEMLNGDEAFKHELRGLLKF